MIALLIILGFLGYYILYPAGVTPDTAIHTEMAELVKEQGYPQTWQPYADNGFTYPPLFHYLAAFLGFFGLPLVEAVRVLGILVFLSVPVTVYHLAKTYNKHAALYAAAVSAMIPALSNVFMMAEFPQLLSMEFILLLIYFLRTKKYMHASAATGLAILSHPLMSVIAVIIHLYHFPFREHARTKILFILIPLIIASFWIPGYMKITENALSGKWANTEYNYPPYNQPVFWFWPPETALDFLFGFGFFTPVLIPLALLGFCRTRDRFLRLFFVFSLAFTVFHLPYTQLKILDMLSIPVIILAAAGISSIELKLGRKQYSAAFIIIVFAFLFCSQINHYVNAKNLWGNPNVPPDALIESSLWLKDYDSTRQRIYTSRASAWAGVISNKLPLNPDISYLESFSDEYRQQLADWKEIGAGISRKADFSQLLKKWNISYLISEENITAGCLRKIHSGAWNVYEVVRVS